MMTLAEFSSTAIHEAWQLQKECKKYEQSDLQNGRQLIGTDYSLKMAYHSDTMGQVTLRYTFNNNPQWTSGDNRYLNLFVSAVLKPQVPLFSLNNETYKKIQKFLGSQLGNGLFANFRAHSIEDPNAFTFYINLGIPFNASLTFEKLQDDILDFTFNSSIIKKNFEQIFNGLMRPEERSLIQEKKDYIALPPLIINNFKELGEIACSRFNQIRLYAPTPFVTYETNTFNYTVSTYQFNFRATEIVMDTAKKVEMFVGTLVPFILICEDPQSGLEQFINKFQSKAKTLKPEDGDRNFLLISTYAKPADSAYTLVAAHQFPTQAWTAEKLSSTAEEFFKSSLQCQ